MDKQLTHILESMKKAILQGHDVDVSEITSEILALFEKHQQEAEPSTVGGKKVHEGFLGC